MDKIVEIDGKAVGLRANALTPRIYRHKIGRDIIRDLQKLQEAATKAEGFKVDDLEIFENVAFIMARQYDSSIPENVEDWLEQFSMFSIYEVLPAIFELWALNNKTTAIPKKK